MPKNVKDNFLNYVDFGGGYNTKDADINVSDDELTGGQNIILNNDRSISKRTGHILYGNYMGSTTKVLNLISHEPAGGTAELLAVYDTNIYRYVTGTWTALTGGATLTTNLKSDHAHFPLTGKTYISNGTDSVQVYTSGATIASDASFKKGKYLAHYKNRLISANLTSSGPDYVWYTDLGVDTFGTNNYFRVEGEVTGLEVLHDKLIVTTKKKVYILQNFAFNGTAAGPEAVIPLRTDFGAIADRTLKRVGNLAFFFGQSTEGISGVYATDGNSIVLVSDKISNDLNSVAPASITNACAVAWGRYYRLSVTMSGQTVNNREYLYDTVAKRWLPPFTNDLGGFSCYTIFETSGQLDIYAGSQTEGTVFRLNQDDFDETPSEKYLANTASYDAAIDANPAKRAAQSFKLSDFSVSQSVPITSIFLKLKKNSGTTTDLTVRIETDNNGTPSGTLADAQATTTISAFTTTAYAYKEASFSNVTLLGNTTYWIVCKHTTEGSGDSKYYWNGDSSSPTYTDGNLALYVDSTSGTITFNPDADAESTSVDGYCSAEIEAFEPGETFANMRAGTGTTTLRAYDSSTTAYAKIGSDSTSNLFLDMQKAIILFDTSSLPDDASISSATVKLYVTYKQDYMSQSIGITSSNPASDTALSTADYDEGVYGSTRYATDLTVASITTGAYNTFTLNTDGKNAINVSGITKFAVRVSCDIDNSAPTWASLVSGGIGFTTADGSNKPQLTVTYTSAGGSAIWTSDADKDLNFVTYTEADIDAYADTKAFFLAPQGQKSHIRDIFITAKASGDYTAEVGVNGGTFDSYESKSFSVSSGGELWGTFVWGTGEFGDISRAESRVDMNGLRSRTAKFRFRNRYANQPFTIYGFRTRHQIIDKFK